VRASEANSLEEDWFFQALIECYLPLVEMLEASASDPQQKARLTMGISPTLLSLLADSTLHERFPNWVQSRLLLLQRAPSDRKAAAVHLQSCFERYLLSWQNSNGDLIGRFSALQQQGVLDLLTCGATHGYMPLLREHPEAVRAQLRTAVREHQRLIGQQPLGIWLPECAYYEGLDVWMRDAGLRYAVLDGHGLLHANHGPDMGCTPRLAAAMAWLFSDATAMQPCPSGLLAMVTPEILPTGNSTVISAGISLKSRSNPLACQRKDHSASNCIASATNALH
jgi:1,4-alpha-glucan branching enzyme